MDRTRTPDAWERWVRATGLHHFVADHYWLWPMSETLHYLGLSLLLGTVGLFDLRVLGMAKAIPPSALHKFIPLGIAGYCVNILTSIAFFSGFPEQYAYNMPTTPPFFWKGVFMAVAGMNVAVFYLSSAIAEVKAMPTGSDTPFRAKLIVAGRLGRGLDLRAALDLLQAADFPRIGPRG